MQNLKQNLVFIVEDNEMYSMMLDYNLSNENSFRFNSFSTGEECIRNLYLNPDLIILDYGLPGINGLDTLKKIKVAKSDVPIVVLTGNNDAKVAKEFMKAGVYDYLLKEELTVQQASKTIRTLLNRIYGPKIRNTSPAFKIIAGIVIIAAAVAAIIILAAKLSS